MRACAGSPCAKPAHARGQTKLVYLHAEELALELGVGRQRRPAFIIVWLPPALLGTRAHGERR